MTRRIGETVPCVVGGLGDDSILDCDAHLNEYVVFGFGFANNVELFDAEGEAAGDGLERPEDAGWPLADETFELP